MAERAWEVPAYEARTFAPKQTRYCVGIPILNEGERILRQLRKMQAARCPADLVIADGGSTDGSTEPDRLAALGVRALLVKQGEGRLGAQLRMLLAYALQEGYAGVVLIDGNDKDDPRAIPRFLTALDEGYDFVQGSRFVLGGRAIDNPLSRLLGIRLVHAPLISLAAGFRYTDTTNGFRALSRRLLEDERLAPFRHVFGGYELHYYLAIRAARLRYRITELPVTRQYPRHGPTPTKISFFRGNLGVLTALFKAASHQYDP